MAHRTFRLAAILVSSLVLMVACSETRPPSAPSTLNAAVTPGASSQALSPWNVATRSAAAVVSWACVSAGAPASQPGLCGRAVDAVVETGAIVPGPALSLMATVSNRTVALAWTAPASGDPASSYVVEAGSQPGAADLASFDTGNTATSLTVTDVPPGTYHVRVRGRNASGNGSASNEVVVTVGGSSPCVGTPGAPSNLVSQVSGSTLTLNWTAGQTGCAATSYQIEAGSASGQSNLANVNTGTSATLFSTANVPTGTYFVRVRGVNGSGSGPASNEVTVVIGGAPPAPGAGLTGRWIGLVAEGDGARNTMFCDERWDWQFDLTQSDSNVTGTFAQTTVQNCPGEPGGSVSGIPVSGSVSGNSFSFTILVSSTRSMTCNATVAGTRMTGSCTHPTSGTATFAVNKR